MYSVFNECKKLQVVQNGPHLLERLAEYQKVAGIVSMEDSWVPNHPHDDQLWVLILSCCRYLSSVHHQFPLICLSNINLNGISIQIHCLVTFIFVLVFDGPDGDSRHVDPVSFFLLLFSLQVAAFARQSASSHSPPTFPITPCPFQLEPLRSTCRCSSQSLQTELPLTSKCPLPPSLPYSCSFPLLDVLKLQLKLVPLPSTSEDSTWPTETRNTLVLLFADTTAALSQHSQSVKAPASSFSTLLHPAFHRSECHNHNITCVPQFHKNNSTGVLAPPQRRLIPRSQDFSELQVDDTLFEGIFDFVNYLPAWQLHQHWRWGNVTELRRSLTDGRQHHLCHKVSQFPLCPTSGSETKHTLVFRRRSHRVLLILTPTAQNTSRTGVSCLNSDGNGQVARSERRFAKKVVSRRVERGN